MPISGAITWKPLQSSLRRLVLYSTNHPSSQGGAEIFLAHLHKDPTHVEKSLGKVKAKLDSPCVTQVLESCSLDKPQLGLRFFIWAGLHQTYRHTSYTYNKACNLLNLERNPRTVSDVLEDYRAEGLAVTVKMFKVILNLCRAAKDEKLGLRVLRKMKEFNCRPDTVSYNVVIRLLVEKGQLDQAMGLMKEMGLIDLYPDMITYISIIKGFCDSGMLEDAFALVKAMKMHGCVPNAVVYSTILDGITRHGSLEMALDFLGEMEKDDNECNKPNVVTYTSLMKGFVDRDNVMDAVRVLDRMSDSNVKPNKVTLIYLLDELCKQGLIDEACKVIDKLVGRGISLDDMYSMLVVSLFRAEKYEESESMLRVAMARGLRPNGLAINCVIIRMVATGNKLMDGFLLFDSLEKSGNFIDSETCSILLDGLCQDNCFTEAAKVVDSMIRGRIVLKPSRADNIVRCLRVSGQHDLASKVGNINNS